MTDILQLPIWVTTLAVLSLCVAICVGGHLAVRAAIPKNLPRQETELAVALMAVIAAFIGIMLAFSAVEVWEGFGSAEKAVADEAAATAELYRDLSVYGDESLPARKALTTYVQTAVDDEWPKMAEGEQSPKTAAALVEVFRNLAAIEPTSPRQTVIYTEAFQRLNLVVEHRRARLLTSRTTLPPLFWLVALLGSAIIVGYTFVYPATPMNLFLIAGLAVSLGLIFVFILEVEHPFAGSVSVEPTEMQGLLPLFEKLNAAPPALAAVK
ncbi:MAG: DUF4239 domain-containing protein [Phenylobacterium sp.]|nr:MAG: DUF4239 domain-containing protein [Phenylobacterium sp.]